MINPARESALKLAASSSDATLHEPYQELFLVDEEEFNRLMEGWVPPEALQDLSMSVGSPASPLSLPVDMSANFSGGHNAQGTNVIPHLNGELACPYGWQMPSTSPANGFCLVEGTCGSWRADCPPTHSAYQTNKNNNTMSPIEGVTSEFHYKSSREVGAGLPDLPVCKPESSRQKPNKRKLEETESAPELTMKRRRKGEERLDVPSTIWFRFSPTRGEDSGQKTQGRRTTKSTLRSKNGRSADGSSKPSQGSSSQGPYDEFLHEWQANLS